MTTSAPDHDVRPLVLIVEDEADVRALLAESLRNAGMAAVCVASDTAAYDALADGGWAALVVDVNLGVGTTGFDVARSARRTHPSIRVVYVTGAVSRGSLAVFGVPGGAFLEKPFRPRELVALLRRTLGLTGPA
jgi:DNA-binding response OmpR family regulator